MATLLQLQSTKTIQRILPTWILRLVGFSSITIAIVNLTILICRRFPPSPPSCQFIKKTATTATSSSLKTMILKRTNNNLINKQASTLPPYACPPSMKWWVLQLLDYVMVGTSKKKRLTISLKNTILWNPSQDINVANHAFNEDAIPLLSLLCQQYEVYLLIHTNNDQEHDQIQCLLEPIIIDSPTTTSTSILDKSRIIYCQDETTKIRMIQHVLCPDIHVEGGCELNDGENMIRGLQSVVERIVWVMTRRRRASFNKENIQPKDQDILTDGGLELAHSLLDSSLARDVGFLID